MDRRRDHVLNLEHHELLGWLVELHLPHVTERLVDEFALDRHQHQWVLATKELWHRCTWTLHVLPHQLWMLPPMLLTWKRARLARAVRLRYLVAAFLERAFLDRTDAAPRGRAWRFGAMA